MTEPRVSFVVIGLDEAAHLAAAIASVRAQEPGQGASEIVYVDSGSRDGSPEIACEAGVDAVLAIDRAGASAARARNTGLARARGRFVQFVDGDTRLEPGWVAAGLAALEADPRLAAVEGALVEARPGANVYHAVCELDWPAGAGPVDFVGGNSLYRRAAIAAAGGFDERMRVGEEPELGFRMRQLGHRFARLDQPMARHDLDLRGFADYWRRGRNSGAACAGVALATGGVRGGYWSERLRTTLVHAGWQLGPLVAGVLALALDVRLGLALIALPLALLAALALRKARGVARSRGVPAGLALAYGVHAYVFKIPSALGALAVLLCGAPQRASATAAAPR